MSKLNWRESYEENEIYSGFQDSIPHDAPAHARAMRVGSLFNYRLLDAQTGLAVTLKFCGIAQYCPSGQIAPLPDFGHILP